ncbi:hypothetical protein BCR36DRAFT_286674, partial [Piromyces finnis]
LFSPNIIIIYKRIMFFEILNTRLFQNFFKIQYVSLTILFVGFVVLLYFHLNSQNYYNSRINKFYSGVWTSVALQSFIYILFTIIHVTPQFYVFFPILFVGFIIGWMLNKYYINWYSKRIYGNIKKKYNKSHICERMKEKKEFNEQDGSVEKSIQTIASEKKIVKKEAVYYRPSDCAYVSCFIFVNQYNRTTEVYIQYWNFLHGIRRYISQNKICYQNDNINELLDNIEYTADKILYKCSTMSRSFFDKYLVYDATFSLESDRSLLFDENPGSGENSASDFELIDIKNRSIQYHLAALNFLKSLMSSLKNLETVADIENTMVINDELTDILREAEGHYKKFIVKFNHSKESLELYILFLRYSLVCFFFFFFLIYQNNNNTYKNNNGVNNIY